MQSADRSSGRISPETIGEILISEGEIIRRQLEEMWNINAESGRGLGENFVLVDHMVAENHSEILACQLDIQ